MTFLPWVKVPELAFRRSSSTWAHPQEQRKRGLLGQWGDAILFAG